MFQPKYTATVSFDGGLELPPVSFGTPRTPEIQLSLAQFFRGLQGLPGASALELSTDEGNILTTGSDGKLFAQPQLSSSNW